MKKEELSDAMEYVDEKLLVAAEEARGTKQKKKTGALRFAGLAASCVLIGGALWFASPLLKKAPIGETVGKESQETLTEERPTKEETVKEETTQAAGSQGTEAQNGQMGESPEHGQGNVQQIALAVYPEQIPYPDEMEYVNEDTGVMDTDAYFTQYDLWSEQNSARNQLSVQTDMGTFLDKTLPVFLGESAEAAGENRVYSPINVYLALGMLAEITDGESSRQVLDLLGVDSAETLRSQISTLWQSNYIDDGLSTCILGNSIWLNEEVNFRQDTLDTLAQDYYASSYAGQMGSEELNQALGRWLNEQTGGLLEEYVQNMELSPATVIALASSIYFKARWDDEFWKDSTEPQTFHQVEGDVLCDFMHQSNRMSLYTGDDFTAVYLPFSNGRDGMWLVLPEEGVTPESLAGDEDVLSMVQSKGRSGAENKTYQVNLSVPKFDVDGEQDLVKGLMGLGVTDVFDAGRSDFTPLTEDVEHLEVSEITHAARVKVDEEGCEAAAYTVIMVETTAAMEQDEEIDFVVDRPFLFYISNGNGLPLFAGVVNQME